MLWSCLCLYPVCLHKFIRAAQHLQPLGYPSLPSTAGGQACLSAVPAVWINCSLSLSTSPTPHLFFSYSLNPLWCDLKSLTSTGACAQTVYGNMFPPSRSLAPYDVSLQCWLLYIEFLLVKGWTLQCCRNCGLYPWECICSCILLRPINLVEIKTALRAFLESVQNM